MATAVRYNGPFASATVRGSDGVTYTCPNGLQVTVPDDTAIALFAEGWTAPDGTTPGYTPPVRHVQQNVFLDNGTLVTNGPGSALTPVTTSLATPLGFFAGGRVVTDRGNSFGTSTGTTVPTGRTCRVRHVVACAGGGIQFVYGNFNGITPGANSLDVKASVELASGTIIPLLFNGRRTVTIEPGGLVKTDPLGLTFARLDVLFERVYVNPTGGTGTIPVELRNRAATYGEGATLTNTDLTDSGVIGNAGNNLYSSVAVIGLATTPANISSWALAGDSQINGTGDTTDEGALDDSRGWATRALSGLTGVLRMTRAGLSTNQRVDPTRTSLHDFTLLGSCTDVLSNMGINDFRALRTKVQLQADLLTYASRVAQRGARFYQSTILPNTDSTDSWVTTANQTVHLSTALEADRVSFNDWLRAGAPIVSGAAVAPGATGALVAGQVGHPITAVFEAADVCETARNSGIWKANSTADGLHPNQSMHTSLATSFLSFVRALNVPLAA